MELATERQKPIVERAIAAGVHILTAKGNAGEFYRQTADEAVAMAEASAEHIDGRVPPFAGVGRSIRDPCRLAEDQGGANMPGVKAALGMIDEDAGAPRLSPVWPLCENQLARLRTFMTDNNLI